MPKKKTKEEIESQLNLVHEGVVSVDFLTYRGSRHKAKFIDRKYGEWWSTPNNVIHHKKSHPKRGKIKQRQTNLRKYGHENPFGSAQIKKKIKQANLERYGFENAFSSKDVRKKWRATIKSRYGVDHPLKLQRNKDLLAVKNSQNKEERNKKTKQTNLNKYGHPNPMQHPDVAKKSAKNNNKSKLLYHWRTGEEVVCVGSYEEVVIRHFNKNKVDFEWQIPFNMPNGKVYIVDCYLPDRDVFVEIKGYFRKDAREKWEWFHESYPNSELWDKNKLKSIKII